MTELEEGDKPVFERAMNIDPEDAVLGGRFRRSNRVAIINGGSPS
jgi:hypothetical protein